MFAFCLQTSNGLKPLWPEYFMAQQLKADFNIILAI